MPLMQSPPGAHTQIDGREYLYFVGTGYLGLQGHPEVIRAACEAAHRYGIGSANSRTAFGTTPPVLEVERLAAAMFGLDDAFYFASGWMGNNILVQLLVDDPRNGASGLLRPPESPCQPETPPHCDGGAMGGGMNLSEVAIVLIDECSHYSLFEAARLNGSPQVTFRHRDPGDLRAKLKEHVGRAQSPLVLSDGVFAATGGIAPVGPYCDILGNYPESMLCLDDAHGLAVLGEKGRGTFEHAGLWDYGVNTMASAGRCPYLLVSGTLSKAVGGFGGIIPGNRDFIDRVKMRSPYFGGASAPPAPVAAATARAIELLLADPGLRTRLRSNVRLLKDGLRRLGLDVDDTPAPIIGLVLGDAENMRRIQRELMARGVAVAYLAAYSGLGPEGALRIAVFATHTETMIQQLLDELRRLV
jgi:8-amino-7-oxononanoate synthase